MKYSKKLPLPSIGLGIVLLISLAHPTSSCTEQEKTSLLQFLAGLSQDAGLAASWQDGTDCCKWEGITCRQDRTVSHVSLASKGLEGQISESIGNLTGLQHLNLSHNSLSGGLPLELVSSSSITILDVSFNKLNGTLQELSSSTTTRPLQVLNISSNSFTGPFPSTVWNAMENLIALNASNNSFTGEIPSHFCNSLPSFTVLELGFNHFSGSIPPGLGDCSMLRVLSVDYNDISGTLPDELFNATSLEYLSFQNNDLYGVLDGACIMKLINLIVLDLEGNYFSGNIPDSIGQLTKLEELHLDSNNLSGELPAALSNCTNLITIDLKINNFGGELAKVNFSNLPNLRTLDLYLNHFNGTVPESIYSCNNLSALRLSSNKLDGQLSPRISDLKHLTFLSLAKNSFRNITNALHVLKSCRNLTTLLIGGNFREEFMPDDDTIDGFENLHVLDIGDCQSFGEIPHWISKLGKLEVLVLSGNQLTGSIPAWIKTLSNLFYLDMSKNSLTGEIPTAMMDMPMLKSEKAEAHLDPTVFELLVYAVPSLEYRTPMDFRTVLNLSSNKLNGEIPLEIGQLKALVSLDLSFNNLTGQIPQSVCSLTNLEMLDLSRNNLIGVIPAALNSLHSLSAFNVSNNDLEGPIPSGGQFNTFDTSSFDANTKLCGSMLIDKCDSAEAAPASILSTKKTVFKAIFMIGFIAFFIVGVLYDQIVLSTYLDSRTFNRLNNSRVKVAPFS